jgi:outer membrane receptor protein involved in Fe transport
VSIFSGYGRFASHFACRSFAPPSHQDAYTVADAYVFVDISKYFFLAVDQIRVTFRGRNLFDRRYAIWGRSVLSRPNPRTYELAAASKWSAVQP